jgi:hypothetical protein
MDRFVKSWWPGTPAPEAWAAYFSTKQGTLLELLTSDELLANGAGMLTDPAVISYPGIAMRGVFVSGQLLCAPISAPPEEATPPRPLMPGETRRSQLEALVENAPCRTCHVRIDPFGDALGNFATDSSYRTVENARPIDTEATLLLPQSGKLTVLDAPSMGVALANSCEAALCLARTMLRDAAISAHLPNDASDQEVARIAEQFTESGLSLPELVRLVVESDAFLTAF